MKGELIVESDQKNQEKLSIAEMLNSLPWRKSIRADGIKPLEEIILNKKSEKESIYMPSLTNGKPF